MVTYNFVKKCWSLGIPNGCLQLLCSLVEYGRGCKSLFLFFVGSLFLFQVYLYDILCMAKTSVSFTADPKIKGTPVGFKLVVNDIFVSAGAGFIVPICGNITKILGLPTRPRFFDMGLNAEKAEINGLLWTDFFLFLSSEIFIFLSNVLLILYYLGIKTVPYNCSPIMISKSVFVYIIRIPDRLVLSRLVRLKKWKNKINK